MSIFDGFSDSPNQIRTEGQEITIRFQRTSDTTGRISWNIPPPAHGCSAANQAYDGIVIAIASTPANYLSTSPKDGVYYEGDPTGDVDEHAGSKLDISRVVAALYHDKTTTFVDISGIKPKTAYYVSGYAVDSVARYHTEGVHAYSLPTGPQSYVTEDYPANHEIEIYSVNPLTPRSLTGLSVSGNYILPLKMECKRYDIPVKGSDAMTFNDLVAALNEQFSLMVNPYTSPSPPHSGSYYRDPLTGLFYIWDGHKLTAVTVLTSAADPTLPVIGAYWYNTVTTALSIYTLSGWEAITEIISSAEAPTILSCSDIWFDGTTVRKWEDNHWCDYTTIISADNPQCAPDLSCNDFWYHTDDKEFFKWNDVLGKWDDALVVYYDQDPNALSVGTYWYDETALKIKRFNGTTWTTQANTKYVDSDANGNYPEALTTTGGHYWYDTKEAKFYQRNLLNTEWVELTFISFPVAPSNRKSCDLWWNSSPSVDDLFVWEAVTSTWVPVTNFYRQTVDPSLPPLLDPETAWVDLEGNIFLIDAQGCAQVNHITSAVNPRELQDGAYWKDENGVYYIYDNDVWVELTDIISFPSNPYTVTNGMLWFNPDTDILNKRVNPNWVKQCIFLDRSFVPTLGEQWFDSVNDILLEWDGTMWLPTVPFIRAEFVQRKCLTDYDSIIFYTKKTGCHESFEILSDGNTLFAGFTNSVIYLDPVDGTNGVDAGPAYLQMGVGTDGSPDERRALHDTIRISLGSPAIRVELTKQQLDRCIDNALLMLRKHSSYAYKNSMFFLDLKPKQQIYKLTNRCVGFNKVVTIIAIHRPKAGAFKMAYSNNDNFAFAALQQMYTLGTFDILTYHLTASYIEELDTLFASRIMFQWVERTRELKLFQVPHGRERVLLEATIERTEQDLLADRETAHWLQRWAIAEAKAMLAQTRGKFVTLPGPNGTTQLNAGDLMTQVTEEKGILIEEIESKGMQDLVEIGARAHLILG